MVKRALNVLAGVGAVLICLLPAEAPQAANADIVYTEQVFKFRDFKLPARVPEGLVLELVAQGLEQPRMITFADNGEALIGSRAGHVYRIPPPYTHPEILLTVRGYPHSLALRPNEILIAQTDGLYRAPYQPGQAGFDPKTVTRWVAIPGGRGHNTRTVRIGPDNRIYMSLGIAGNCSNQYVGADYSENDRRGGVMVLNEDGAQPEWQAYASGLRNPVDYDWQPQTGVMYSSNNGPDHWGYDKPQEYFSKLLPGSFHGMPWFQHVDGEFRADECIDAESAPRPATEATAPVALFPARNAPLGVAFVPDGALDARFAGDAVVALHGSWATLPDGGGSGDPTTRRPPKLVVVHFDDGEAGQVADLVSGFQLEDGRRWARPAGVAAGPDGALYFTSDDGINGLFRLRRAQ